MAVAAIRSIGVVLIVGAVTLLLSQVGAKGQTPAPDGRPAAGPDETHVEVLDGGAGPERTEAVARRLRELGYPVVAVRRAPCSLDVTTVHFGSGRRPEAEALRALDARFSKVEDRPDLGGQVWLHVVVGTDWTAD
jgi:hypothetical protein